MIMKKYIKPIVKVQTIGINAIMLNGSLVGGNTNTQLTKEKDDWDEFGSEY